MNNDNAQHVWVVPTFSLDHVSKHNFASNMLYEGQHTKFHDGVKANDRGELLSEDYFPKAIYPVPKFTHPKDQPPPKDIKRLPQVFSMGLGGHWVISERCKDILSAHDLGKSQFFPVQILQPDRETAFPGSFFFVNFAEQKSTILLDKSEGKMKYQFGETYHILPCVEDDQVIVDSTSIEGADLWVDSGLEHAFFMSNRLANALDGENLKIPWRMKRCLIKNFIQRPSVYFIWKRHRNFLLSNRYDSDSEY